MKYDEKQKALAISGKYGTGVKRAKKLPEIYYRPNRDFDNIMASTMPVGYQEPKMVTERFMIYESRMNVDNFD